MIALPIVQRSTYTVRHADTQSGRWGRAPLDRQTKRDLRILAQFIDIYCSEKHSQCDKQPVRIGETDVSSMVDHPTKLCSKCAKLLAHAFVKRMHCPMDPKPACKRCPNHCYHPAYRKRMQDVMRYSGLRLIFSGRLSYLLHFFF